MYRRLTTPWTTGPGAPSIGAMRWFAIGDIHGQGPLLAHTLATIRDLGRDTPFGLVFLGDLIDRGPNGWACLEMAADAQAITGAQTVHLLAGNHELMMQDMMEGRMRNARQWLDNGGAAMLDELTARTNDPYIVWSEIKDGLQAHRPAYFSAMRAHVQIGDYLFVHAGICPFTPIDTFLATPMENADQWAQSHGHWAWIRWSFLQHAGPWHGNPALAVVHGHTPALRKPAFDCSFAEETLFPGGFHRICLDGGAAFQEQALVAEFSTTQVRLHCLTTDGGWLP